MQSVLGVTVSGQSCWAIPIASTSPRKLSLYHNRGNWASSSQFSLSSSSLSASVSVAAMASSERTLEESRWVSFPFLSSSGKRLMEEIADTIASELSPSLNPTRTPADVRHFKNSEANGEGSVTLRSGKPGSSIDFVLGSWLHCNLPFGTLNIATLIGIINRETDAPHLLFEFIQTGANSLVLVLDLLPRKDLVLDPAYLKQFYEDTALESIKQELQKAPRAQRYEPPTLYIRCLTSPTCIMYKFEGRSEPDDDCLDRIIEEAVSPTAKKVIKVWLEGVLTLGRDVPEAEAHSLLERDTMIKTKGVEVDLSSNMPRLFGQEIADRVIEAFRRGE